MPSKPGWFLISILLVFGIAPAGAQVAATRTAPATENITVTGTKASDAAISKFVSGLSVPTRVAGKLSRWKDGICPLIQGARPDVEAVILQKMRQVAAEVGAPVNTSETCANNIEIMFTAQPQAMLDNIRTSHPNLLGYSDNSAQAAELATMRLPVQSWYITGTVDRLGQMQVDGARKGGVTITMAIPQAGIGGPATTPDMVTMNFPDAAATNATSGYLNDGLSSVITNVVIVADISKLLDGDIYTLADYIAMLALSQVKRPDSCQDLPTILNLLVPNCSQTPGVLTAADIAYLKALYKITPTATASGQRNEMAYQMNKALAPKQ